MKNVLKSTWRFLASVTLALTTLFTLAAASVIGTVIRQGEPPGYYVTEYGETLAWFFQALQIPSLYSSWWFVALLVLFALNLVVCSCKRLPGAWRLVVQDNLATDLERLRQNGSKHMVETGLTVEVAADRMQQLMSRCRWKKTQRRDFDGSTLLFAQQGGWTRLGVHLVHLSILVILAGAVIGAWFGFKAYVILPEMRSTTQAYLQGQGEAVPLGFELWYDRFGKAYYDNGQVREYRADLTVYDPERGAPYQKSSVVNDPLQHRGISFYLADNYPLEEYFVVVRNQRTGEEQAFRIPPQRQIPWQGTDISFRVEEVQRSQDGAAQRARITFADGAAPPATFWMHDKSSVTLERPGGDYTFAIRQLYSTLFLVTKDPGVWLIWAGSLLMLIGLGVSFGLSHQRLWILIAASRGKGARILASGTSNKHQTTFEIRFRELAERIEQEASDAPPRLTPAEIGRAVKKGA